ncbi:LapA family protein [Streptomyces brevispora]|uniref:LapA family protein n=1 Tax=Streptomyces brevispora TaxID=887462 RepID=A0A561V5E3_9ACTN|nr:LapA family protein [Streptomyces brevispora]TWG06816.1 putative secreted protein with PEP-CTERM sorting signal [Streptomyces brevispora]WSC12315.1 LapA family protein [Streptomyces brevispora]
MSPKDVSSSGKGGTGAFSPARILVLVLAVLSVVFIAENTGDVTVRLLIPVVTIPLYVALIVMFLAGMACGAYVFRRRRK